MPLWTSSISVKKGTLVHSISNNSKLGCNIVYASVPLSGIEQNHSLCSLKPVHVLVPLGGSILKIEG